MKDKSNIFDWHDWVWQQKNSINNTNDLKKAIPNLPDDILNDIAISNTKLKFKITPYLLSLIETDKTGVPLLKDPIWKQIIPASELFNGISVNKISEFDENWEIPDEMITSILHHKYYNRVVLRIQNSCMSYCMYCFETKKILDISQNNICNKKEILKQSLEYIKFNKQIDEVILSGGEPLLMTNKSLEEIFSKLRNIKHIKAIRIHTRVLTHNPFRIDTGLLELLNKFDITCLNVHFSHPNEITKVVEDTLKKISMSTRIIILAHIPLLKGINDNVSILLELFMKLYKHKVLPYYLLHAIPNTLGASVFRTTVKKGVELMRQIKRTYSNPAIPEYIIVHNSSKHTVPLEINGTSEFEYHKGYIRFLNYKNKWCIYRED